MNRTSIVAGIGIALALASASAIAAQQDPGESMISRIIIYTVVLFISFAVAFGIVAYLSKLRDKRSTTLTKIIQGRAGIKAVGPEALVTECVRTMSSEKIGALIVLNGEKLAGIFTERDALNRVLAAGLDPRTTKISDVMTKDPVSVSPGTTVGEAMELVTKRRFRHLPVVENGKVLALVSSGDLTHWLVKDQLVEVRDVSDPAAKT
ncbi:MAG: CBS domain-containing protein [Proteobacteria bacterium]|nr:CBS domain-containing protein [Pseudomonadota bacterium]